MPSLFSFFFHYTPPTDIYTLSLHDALPIFALDTARFRIPRRRECLTRKIRARRAHPIGDIADRRQDLGRSEEHTSELQSRLHLVCRLLLEKKKEGVKTNRHRYHPRFLLSLK